MSDGGGTNGEQTPFQETRDGALSQLRSVDTRLLRRIILALVAGIFISKIMSWSLVVFDDVLERYQFSSLWERTPTIKGVQEQCAFIQFLENGHVQVNCQGEIYAVRMLDIREVRGVPYDKASLALSRALFREPLQKTETANCSIKSIEVFDDAFPIVGAICFSEKSTLSYPVLVAGLAEAEKKSWLRELYSDDRTVRSLIEAERLARRARRGLHNDVFTARLTRQVAIQNWISTLLGIVGAIAVFLMRAEAEKKSRKVRLSALFVAAKTSLSRLIDGKEANTTKFESLIKELEKELRGLPDSIDYDVPISGLRKISESVKREEPFDVQKKLKVADAYWEILEPICGE